MRPWPGIQEKHWSLLVYLLRGVELTCQEDSEAALEKDCVYQPAGRNLGNALSSSHLDVFVDYIPRQRVQSIAKGNKEISKS